MTTLKAGRQFSLTMTLFILTCTLSGGNAAHRVAKWEVPTIGGVKTKFTSTAEVIFFSLGSFGGAAVGLIIAKHLTLRSTRRAAVAGFMLGAVVLGTLIGSVIMGSTLLMFFTVPVEVHRLLIEAPPN